MASGTDHLDELDQFYKKKVEFPPKQLEGHINTATREVGKLLQEMKKFQKPGLEPVIADNIIPTGSSYEGLKVRGEMELDFMIPLSHPEFNFVPLSHASVPGGYRQLKVERHKQLQKPQTVSTPSNPSFENEFTEGGFLIPSKVYHWFQSLADRAMNSIRDKVRFPVRFTGYQPARRLVITLSPDNEIYVDLVLAVFIGDGLYVVAKPLKMAPELLLWRLSFSVFEKDILNQLPSSSCHLKTLKILKYLREHDTRLEETSQFASGICSYHLKTAFFHLLTRTHPTQWEDTAKNLRARLDDLMELLIKGMEEGQLNHFFLGNKSSLAKKVGARSMKSEAVLNLFDAKFMNATTLNQAKGRLIIIKSSLPAILKKY
ncbi:inositol 1,4,5-trisphosphate receptor-interacting protein-like [Petromyzon marinus]|uniref:Inositol 1,4,5-trisphosphate receptor-interacting protein-like n=1 Tax=Petromyzon marinus TaxID=7757 RepID=A0AAJ7UBR3_PETMA|nr:inositol 1,4,5-trisphosphate receptor-interacting protein-like [Petromyzon marinus]